MNHSPINNPDNYSNLKNWVDVLQVAFLKGKPPDVWPEATSETQDYKRLVDDLLSIHNFILQLADGDLSSDLKVKGGLAGSLISLQSNLRHLTWQVQQVAAGDLTQHIEFMGNLADLFNQMIQSLKKTRTELLESEERYRLLAENAADVIWTMDLNGNFTYISPSVKQLRGFSVDEAMAQTIEESLTPASAQFVRERMQELLVQVSKGEEVKGGIFQLEQSRKDGSILPIEVTISRLDDHDGNLVGIQGASRDITERVKTQIAEHEQRVLAEALSNTAAALNSAMSLDEVFDCLLKNIGHVVPHDTVDILTVDPTGHARIKRSEGYQHFSQEAQSELSTLVLSVEDTFNLRTMRDTCQPLLIHNLSDINWVQTKAAQWARSHLGTPIQVKGRLAGFLIL